MDKTLITAIDDNTIRVNGQHVVVVSDDKHSDAVKDRSPVEDSFTFSNSPTLEDVRQSHASFIAERNWEQFHTPRNVLLALVAEMGELSECFQWKNECQIGLKDWTPKEKIALEEELSDCLVYLVRLADRCRVDLPAAVTRKLAKNAAKYPTEKVYGSSKKYTEYQ
ncbi:dCTP pyrophosphatase 1-like [Oppia nitens]|uniref:dCTP pyrophosphatase 1-like n=1 Tax=Oppia nitens TaxID=1686743 RepID=UPI0023D9AC98|nr:dCTP pyrophosphatase 1-like [Oppia nitens]